MLIHLILIKKLDTVILSNKPGIVPSIIVKKLSIPLGRFKSRRGGVFLPGLISYQLYSDSYCDVCCLCSTYKSIYSTPNAAAMNGCFKKEWRFSWTGAHFIHYGAFPLIRTSASKEGMTLVYRLLRRNGRCNRK